jgi:hypothetical protein
MIVGRCGSWCESPDLTDDFFTSGFKKSPIGRSPANEGRCSARTIAVLEKGKTNNEITSEY